MTLVVVKVQTHTKFHQANYSGSQVIVSIEKQTNKQKTLQ